MIKNEVNNKFYIGSSKNISKRWSIHKSRLKLNKHANIYLQRSYNKHGKDIFSYIVLEETSIDNLLLIEQNYLNMYINDEKCYNIGMKSSGGDNLTNNPNRDEIIKKIVIGLKENWKDKSDEEKLYFSERVKGEKNPNYGNNWTEDMKKIASERTTEYYKNHEQPLKNKKIEDFYGVDKAKEIKYKMSEYAKNRIGEKNGFYGKEHSEETKEKLRKKRIGNYYGEQNIPFIIDNIEYSSLGIASKKLEINITTIRWRLKSNNKKFDNYQYIKQ